MKELKQKARYMIETLSQKGSVLRHEGEIAYFYALNQNPKDRNDSDDEQKEQDKQESK